MSQSRSKLEQTLGWGLVTLLFFGCLLVMWPFVTALLWAGVLAFTIWPLYRRLFTWLGGKRTLSAMILSTGMVLAVALPLAIAGFALKDDVVELKTGARRLLDEGLPAAPDWLAKIPIVGKRATERWDSLAADATKLEEKAETYVEPVSAWLLRMGLKLGAGLGQLAVSGLLTFFLLRSGVTVAGALQDGIERIGGERGKRLLLLAGDTVRGVVYGILGTALAQAIMAWIGFAVAGVPGAALLGLFMFFLSVVPLGPPLLWLPAALWLFHQGAAGWGIFMLVWGMGVSLLDNVVKPWLISQGSAMPFVLILFGVVGGAMTFGFIGVFLGPTLLAVGYRLVREWASASGAVPEPEQAPRIRTDADEAGARPVQSSPASE